MIVKLLKASRRRIITGPPESPACEERDVWTCEALLSRERWNTTMLSAAIFFHDNHGVITPLSPIGQSDFLPVDTGDVKGDKEVLESNKQIILIVPFHFSKFINTKVWFASH